jgi:hypothetical protein
MSLLRQGFAFLAGSLFRYETYYLYESRLQEIDETKEADVMPGIPDFTSKIVFTNQEADELVVDGYEFRYSDGIHRERLDKGAIAVCVFVGRELAHIGWVAMNEEAMRSIITLPYRVDFSSSKVFLGGVWTHPEYRGRGLHTYGLFKRREFIQERGAIIGRGIIDTSNVASQKGITRLSHEIYGKARYLKILWWKSWKETPTSQISH